MHKKKRAQRVFDEGDFFATSTLTTSVSELETNLKRQRLEDDDSILETREPLTYSEIHKTFSENCFLCRHMNSYVFNDKVKGPLLMQLFKIYTDSRANLPTHAIAMQMKEFYDNVIYPKQEKKEDCPLRMFVEHIDKHCYFPTAELLEQLLVLRNYRLLIQDQIFTKDSDGKIYCDEKMAKLLVIYMKQINTLMGMKSQVPDMLGFNQTLKF